MKLITQKELDALEEKRKLATPGKWHHSFSRYYCDYKNCTNPTYIVTENCTTGEKNCSCAGHDNENWSLLHGPDSYKPDDKRLYPNGERFIYARDAAYIAAANPETIGRILETMRRMRECLEFYGNEENWAIDRLITESAKTDIEKIDDDSYFGFRHKCGLRARKILREMDENNGEGVE